MSFQTVQRRSDGVNWTAMLRRALLLACLVVLGAPCAAAAAPTGRVLVLLEPGAGQRAHAAATQAFLARTGARRSGPQVPEIGLVTVARPAGRPFAAFARALRADPAVRSVQPEGRMTLRAAPNDPALTRPETTPGTPPGTPMQWPAAKQRFQRAWDLARDGAGAVVGVIDTGVDGSHPELAGKVAVAVDHEFAPTPATTDQEGHGTHVASLACAATDNGIGFAGAGRNCRLIVEKIDLSDASIAESIVDATNRGALALNMSFGDDGNRPPVEAIRAALDFAVARGVVLVAAAADENTREQGQPANLLQPTGTGPNLAAGKGLTVTSATFDDRNSGAGVGTQISLAAVGSFYTFSSPDGPPGLLGAVPKPARRIDGDLGVPPVFPCGCRTSLDGDDRYAYLQGTSMAAPQVAAIAALMRRLNPDAGVADVLRALKQTARRPTGAWTDQLGWGILDAGAAVEAVSVLDRRPPVSRARAARRTRARRFRVRFIATDPTPPGVRAGGVRAFELWRSVDGGRFRPIARTARRSVLVRGAGGHRYAFFTVARDRAGNREARPRRADVTVRVLR
jgi:serine protease